jgi:hypothetical protein
MSEFPAANPRNKQSDNNRQGRNEVGMKEGNLSCQIILSTNELEAKTEKKRRTST